MVVVVVVVVAAVMVVVVVVVVVVYLGERCFPKNPSLKLPGKRKGESRTSVANENVEPEP